MMARLTLGQEWQISSVGINRGIGGIKALGSPKT